MAATPLRYRLDLRNGTAVAAPRDAREWGRPQRPSSRRIRSRSARDQGRVGVSADRRTRQLHRVAGEFERAGDRFVDRDQHVAGRGLRMGERLGDVVDRTARHPRRFWPDSSSVLHLIAVEEVAGGRSRPVISFAGSSWRRSLTITRLSRLNFNSTGSRKRPTAADVVSPGHRRHDPLPRASRRPRVERMHASNSSSLNGLAR
jgi:hypothetical protein